MHLYKDIASLMEVAGKPVLYEDIKRAGQSVVDGLKARTDKMTNIQMPVMIGEFTAAFENTRTHWLKPFVENDKFLKEIEACYNSGCFMLTNKKLAELVERCSIDDKSEFLKQNYRLAELNKFLFLRHINRYSSEISITSITTKTWAKIAFQFEIKTPNLIAQAELTLSPDDIVLNASKMTLRCSELEGDGQLFGFQFTQQQCNLMSQILEDELAVLVEVLDDEHPTYTLEDALNCLNDAVISCMSVRALMLHPEHPDRALLDKFFDGHNASPIKTRALLYHAMEDLNSLRPQQYINNTINFYSSNPMDTRGPTDDKQEVCSAKLPLLRIIINYPLLEQSNNYDIEFLFHLNRLVETLDEQSVPGKYIKNKLVTSALKDYHADIVDYERCLNLSETISESIEQGFIVMDSKDMNHELSRNVENSL